MRVSAATRLNQFVRIERPVAATGFTSAGKGSWELVDQTWAEIRDIPPSRTERTDGGFTATNRSSRVRMRFREDVTPAMRIVLGNRIMQIIGGPAELGRRELVEFMVEDFRPAGNRA